MAQGIPILKDAPYNVLTVPNYVRNLVVTTKPAQVIAAYTAPPVWRHGRSTAPLRKASRRTPMTDGAW